MKRAIALLLALLVLCLCAPALGKSTPTPEPTATPAPLTEAQQYENAKQMAASADWLGAVNAFAALSDYEEAATWYRYARAMLLWSREDPASALALLDELGDFEGAAAQAARIRRLSVHRWWDAGLFGYVDLAGNVAIEAAWSIVPRAFDERTARPDAEGNLPADATYYAAVYQGAVIAGETDQEPDPQNPGAWGVLASDGAAVLPCEHAAIGWIESGYAAVQDADGWRLFDLVAGAFVGDVYTALGALGEGPTPDTATVPAQQGEQWGYVSLPDGKALGEGFVYERCEPMAEGFGAYVREGLAGFVDVSGQPALTTEYQDARSFSEGLAAVRYGRKRWGFINAQGELVIEAKYQDVGAFIGGVCPFQYSGRWGTMDATGEMLLAARYDEIAHIDPAANRLWMRKNKLWGIALLDGTVLTKPAYSTTTGFSANRVAGVSYRGAFGYVDVRGTTFIPLEYPSGTTFSAGLGAVGDGGDTVHYLAKFNAAFDLYGNVPVAPLRGFIESRVRQTREIPAADGEGQPVVESWYEYRLFDLQGEAVK